MNFAIVFERLIGHVEVRDALNTIAGAVPVLTPLAIWRITQ